jgi:quercetin dioxygenase-like cupin family protein
MGNVRKCVCLIVTVFFLSGPLTFQVWAGPPQEQAVSSEKPRLVFDATTHDAGEVWEGEVVSHSFVVKNTGTAELTINKVKPG